MKKVLVVLAVLFTACGGAVTQEVKQDSTVIVDSVVTDSVKIDSLIIKN